MKLISSFITFAVIAVIALLVTDSKVMLSETLAIPGQHYVVEEYGDLGRHRQPTLHCGYFTGRKIINRVFWYSPNKQYGRDSCPFLIME